MRRLLDLAKRFRKDESGAFMVLFAILALVLIATSGAVVDFTYTQTARTRAQTALDSAALALQTQISTQTTTQLKAKAQSLLTQRLADSSITATVNTVTVDTVAGKINLQASLVVPTAFVQLVGIHNITTQLTSEVQRGSKDIEVSVALDTTLSMAGSKISSLISATNTLIDLVVQTSQTPTYSKMAIVPWSYGANMGSTYAVATRGAVTGATNITAATWMSGTTKTPNAITKANPAVVTTSAAHGFTAGDYVYVSGISGMTQITDGIYKVGTTSGSPVTKFQLLKANGTNVNSTSYSTFSTSGSPKVTKCLNSSCQVLITTSTAHGHVTGDTVYISGVNGMTGLNGTHATAVGTVPATTTYYLTDETASSVLYTAYTNSGSSYCTKYGCYYYYFTNTSGNGTLYQVNNCTTERTTNAYTDAAPTTTLLGYNYTNGGSSCETQTIQPLTTDKTVLHALANSLTAQNSTAGHLGLAWGWYMISPNFGYLWPTASQPAAYARANLVKAVILMTDGVFNTQYCNGVNDGTINCDSPNGVSHDQAVALCNAIKAPANDTILYTVGFDLGGDTASLNFLQGCATSTADFFQADTGADLTTAFTAIAQNLNNLRISK